MMATTAGTAVRHSGNTTKEVLEITKGASLRIPIIEIEETPEPEDQRAKESTAKHQQQSHPGPGLPDRRLRQEDDQSKEHDTIAEPGFEGESSSDQEEDDGNEDAHEERDPWDDSSLLEAAFEELDEDSHTPQLGAKSTADVCSAEEGLYYRRLLRRVGVDEFVRETLEDGNVSAKKLCSAFGLKVPFLEDEPDEAFYRLLGMAITRELQKRMKLDEWNTIDDAVKLLKKARNVIVVTGAGISTSLGIPDFRSQHNGLYARLEHLGLADPQEVFSLELFNEDPSIFFSVAKDILPETKRFTPTHAFIKMLQDKGKLLVNYTQNIDNIEGHAGVDASKVIQCHGSFATATCQKCRAKVSGDEVHDEIKAGKIPKCKVCIHKAQQMRPAVMKRKRSSDHRGKARRHDYEDSSSDEDFTEEPGVMKPDITFFGEDLPDTFHDRLKDTDYSIVDLVIVIGTSLRVAPVAEIPNFVSQQNEDIPQIYISRDACNHIAFDIELLGECDVVIAELCRRAGWNLDHAMAVPMTKEIEVFRGTEEWQWDVSVKRVESNAVGNSQESYKP